MNRHFHLLDPNFNPKKNYFFKELKAEKIEEIGNYIHEYFQKGDMNKVSLEKYLNTFPAIPKLTKNIENLQNK